MSDQHQNSTQQPDAKASAAPAAQPTAPTGDADKLGDAGKKALDAERDARKKAESDLAAIRKDFDGFRSALGEAFGVKPEKGNDDTLNQVQTQLAQMQHESAVYRLAAQHQITDEGDLDLLKSAKDEQALTKLAERLAARAGETKPGTPKPDATQGAQGAPAGSPEQDFANFLGAQLGGRG